MAEHERPFTKATQTPEAISSAGTRESLPISEVGVMDDGELDQLLADSDPDFLQALKGIGGDKSLFAEEIHIEEKVSIIFRIKRQALGVWIRVKNFAYYLWSKGIPAALTFAKLTVGSSKDKVLKTVTQFKKLKLKLKLILFSLLLLTLMTIFLIYRSLTGGILWHQDELFIPSLESVSGKVYQYDPATEVQRFYDNEWTSQNVILIQKLVVNIKRSEHSGENPMAAFEFIVEGLNPDILIRLKELEIPVRDLMQRKIEEFSFDDLDSADGKRALLKDLAKELNDYLAERSIKSVRIKTVVLKP